MQTYWMKKTQIKLRLSSFPTFYFLFVLLFSAQECYFGLICYIWQFARYVCYWKCSEQKKKSHNQIQFSAKTLLCFQDTWVFSKLRQTRASHISANFDFFFPFIRQKLSLFHIGVVPFSWLSIFLFSSLSHIVLRGFFFFICRCYRFLFPVWYSLLHNSHSEWNITSKRVSCA